MSIAIFQLLVSASIFVSARFGSWVQLLVCILWTLFTLIFVYTSPLAVLQLLTIWGSYWLYSRAGPAEEKPPFSALQKINESVASLNDELTVRQFVMQAVSPLNAVIHQERVVIESALESARQQLAFDKDLAQKGPEYRAIFEASYSRFTTLQKTADSETKPLVLLPDFNALPRPGHQRVELALDEEIRYLREERTRRLDWVRKAVRTDLQLQQLFENRLRNHNAAKVWDKEFCPRPAKPLSDTDTSSNG